MLTFFKRYNLTILIGIIFIAVWAIVTKYATWINPVIFPQPITVIQSFSVKIGELLNGVVSSMKLLIPGFFGALIIGVVGGCSSD